MTPEPYFKGLTHATCLLKVLGNITSKLLLCRFPLIGPLCAAEEPNSLNDGISNSSQQTHHPQGLGKIPASFRNNKMQD